MPKTKNGFLSTSAIARHFIVERDIAFNFLQEIGWINKNILKKRYELSELGFSKGGEYQSSTGDSQWIIWPRSIIEEPDLVKLSELTSKEEKKQHLDKTSNKWTQYKLKYFSELIDEKCSLDFISTSLNIEKKLVIKKLISLPRLNKKYQGYKLQKDQIEPISDIQIIESLANGINPYTNISFKNDHILQNSNVTHALFKALKSLNNNTSKTSTKQYKSVDIQDKNPIPINSIQDFIEKYKQDTGWKKYKSKITKNIFVKRYLYAVDGSTCPFCHREFKSEPIIHHLDYDHTCTFEKIIELDTSTIKRPNKMTTVPDCESCHNDNNSIFLECMNKLMIVHSYCNKRINDVYTTHTQQKETI